MSELFKMIELARLQQQAATRELSFNEHLNGCTQVKSRSYSLERAEELEAKARAFDWLLSNNYLETWQDKATGAELECDGGFFEGKTLSECINKAMGAESE